MGPFDQNAYTLHRAASPVPKALLLAPIRGCQRRAGIPSTRRLLLASPDHVRATLLRRWESVIMIEPPPNRAPRTAHRAVFRTGAAF